MKKPARYLGPVALFGAAVGCLLLAILAQQGVQAAKERALADPPRVLMVLQGRVTDTAAGSITIRTPDIRPAYVPGRMTPMFILAGRTYKIDIGKAVFETSMGTPTDKEDLNAGDAVVVVCNPTAPNTGQAPQPLPATALVVERIAITTPAR